MRFVAFLLGLVAASAQAQTITERGSYTIHLLLHAIGTESYTVTRFPSGDSTLASHATLSDRGSKRTINSSLDLSPLLAPIRLEQSTLPANPDGGSVAEIAPASTTIREGHRTRTFSTPPEAFVGFTSMPASLQMMMIRFWKVHHQPARLNLIRVGEQALPVEIKLVGHDSYQSLGRMVRFARYTVANVVFGREILWMDDSNRLAAVMTFAGGLPQEIVLDEDERLMGELYHSGVRQEMLDLAELTQGIRPVAGGTGQGAYAIVGARLIDGKGEEAVERSTVIVRNGRIAAVGPEESVPVPPGLRVIHAEGQTLIPGLWEMHVHYSGVEFGPALLARGITTARDCGGEMEFLTSVRREIDQSHLLGPRLLLAGLIDSGGPLAFGAVDVETVDQAVAAVDAYSSARFDQIKVYSELQPEELRAITGEAHRLGMTVTGHVPDSVTTGEGIEDGMDQINHLDYITEGMKAKGDSAPPDLQSRQARELIDLLARRQIVVDPTEAWGEMAGHPKNMDVSSFEPGIGAAPYPLAARYEGMGVPAAKEGEFRAGMASDLAVIRALVAAGVPIVAGGDTGLVGYGLERELELYVQAGMTPMQALQSATLVAARAMHRESEAGTIEVGKRADLVLLAANPLDDISNVRRVNFVVTAGRMYSSAKLAQLAGFSR